MPRTPLTLAVIAALALPRTAAAQDAEAVVAELRQAMRAEQASARAEAVRRAGELGPQGLVLLDAVVARLTDDENEVRLAASLATAQLRPDLSAACQKLTTLFRDGSEFGLGGGAGGLFEPDPRQPPTREEVERLVTGLSDPDAWGKVWLALREVRDLKPIPAPIVEAIVPLLANDSEPVRRLAAVQLGRAPDHPAVFPALLETLDSEHTRMRVLAVDALPVDTPERRVASRDRLLALLRDAQRSVRMAVLRKLVSFDDQAAEVAPALAAVVELGDDELSRRALKTLRRLRPASIDAIAAVARLLEHEDVSLAVAAARSLGSCKSHVDAALPSLFEAARSDSVPLRAAAVDALQYVGPERTDVRLVLLAALQDPAPAVAQRAMRCWEYLTWVKVFDD